MIRLIPLIISLGLVACQTTKPPEPWSVKVYSGDPKRLGLARGADFVQCSDAAFDKMVCMNSDDFSAMIGYLLKRECVD
jgi:hypothetical protein